MNLSIGILVVGSLYWESKDCGGAWACEQNPVRVVWRSNRLRSPAEHEFAVNVPIRYGRKSQSRGGTFTMVFSPEYNQRQGTGTAIRCEANVTSIEDLIEEAEELWKAESNGQDGRLSDSWGCVTLIVSDRFLEHADRSQRQQLLNDWAARVSSPRESSYGNLGFSERDREAAQGQVIADGRLRIPWPSLSSGEPLSLDLLLATATNPGVGANGALYPTAQQVADAWNRNGHVYYFRCNRLAGIHTADDEAIEKFLR